MTHDDKTSPDLIPSSPSTPVNRANITDTPYDLTAKTLSRLAADTLSPDHPAADLRAMNDSLLNLLFSEGDQSRMLARQAQVLDSLFHFLTQRGMAVASTAPAYMDGDHEAAAPSPIPPDVAVPDLSVLMMALKSQRQCAETVRGVSVMDYMTTVQEAMQNRPAPAHLRTAPKSVQKSYAPPTPSFDDEQSEESDLW